MSLEKPEKNMLIALPNLASSRTFECKPWEIETIAPPRDQWNSPTVQHTFYSGFEGMVSSMRIDSKNNPAIKLHWLVVDYDGPIDIRCRIFPVHPFTHPHR